jgi:hypothetical protein
MTIITTPNSAGYVPPEGKLFYIVKQGQSKVLQIRKVVKINGTKMYLIDQPHSSILNVSLGEFYTYPTDCNMIKVE